MPLEAAARAFFCSSVCGFAGSEDLAEALVMLSVMLFIMSSPEWPGTVDLSRTLAKRAGALVSAQMTWPERVLPTTEGVC